MPETNACTHTAMDALACTPERPMLRKSRLRLWEIDHFFKCPVVGMCLTLAEQKQLLKKTGFKIKDKSTFEIHELLVAASERESRLSRKADALLWRKYGKHTRCLLGLDHQSFKADFMAAFESGECPQVTWATAVHPDLPAAMRRFFFGEIHMSMHRTSERFTRLKQNLTQKEKENRDLRRRLQNSTRLRRSLQKENHRLKNSQAQLTAKMTAVEIEKDRIKDKLTAENRPTIISRLERGNRLLKKKLESLMLNGWEKQRQSDLLEEKNRQLSAELERQREINIRLSREAREIIRDISTLDPCDQNCPAFDLCKKRILIVGGITRMESLYRELIESSGGIFEYHDGYIRKGTKSLEGRLKRADMIVCPVNCNSHAACSMVKNLAKKHNKTVYMLDSSSLTAVSRVIWGSRPSTLN